MTRPTRYGLTAERYDLFVRTNCVLQLTPNTATFCRCPECNGQFQINELRVKFRNRWRHSECAIRYMSAVLVPRFKPAPGGKGGHAVNGRVLRSGKGMEG